MINYLLSLGSAWMLKREEATERILARAGEDLLITLPVPIQQEKLGY